LIAYDRQTIRQHMIKKSLSGDELIKLCIYLQYLRSKEWA
jgi:hypothetical protein